MPPQGPMLPRKNTHLKRTRESIEGAAFHIGVLVAVERNRQRQTQGEIAGAIGVDQVDISAIENGHAAQITDAQFDRLFQRLQLPVDMHASFLKWWRDEFR